MQEILIVLENLPTYTNNRKILIKNDIKHYPTDQDPRKIRIIPHQITASINAYISMHEI